MTCDDAFELLTTSGGRSNAKLLAHLDTCPRCQTMAEALEPALDLFGDRAPAPITGSGEAVTIAQSAARRLSRRASRSPARHWFSSRTAGLALAGFAGAACCFLALQSTGRDGGKSTASCPRHSAASTDWMNRNAVPVAMACIACHPPAGSIAPVSGPTPAGRGAL